MRLLFIIPRNPIPARDGGALGMVGSFKGLHDAGHELDLLVLNTKRHTNDPAVLREMCHDVTSVDIDTTVTAVGAFRNVIAPRRSGVGGWRLRGRSVPLSYWIERFVHDRALSAMEQLVTEREPYDAYVCDSLFTCPYGFEILRMMDEGRIPRRPVLLRSHNVEYQIQERMAHESSRPLLERLYRAFLAYRTRRFEYEVIQHFDGVQSVTESDSAMFRVMNPNVNVLTIAPGVQTPDPAYLAIEPQPKTLCLLSSLEWAPNVQGALWFLDEVMPRITAAVPDAVVHVAGRGHDDRVAAHHNGSSIIYHGEVEDATAMRASCAVSIVPLFSGSGIRIKIQEAMALARPVVSTSLGADGIPATHGEHIMIADDAASFADACIRLLLDADAARTMGQAAKRFADERYSWRAFVDKLTAWSAEIQRRLASGGQP